LDSLFSFLAEYFYLIVALLAVVFSVIFYRKQWLGLIIGEVFILGMAYLLSKIATQLISDPRPFIESGVPALIQSATDNGFPSDHTLFLASIAATVTLVNWKAGAGFLGLTLLVGAARVYARVHHWLDIGGSLVIVAIALLLYLGVKTLVEQWLPVSKKYNLLLPQFKQK
jgi:membrane-associated phospholipid phosphatase